MKKYITVALSLIILILSFSAFSLSAADVDSVENNSDSFDETQVLKSRFLNILNHNFVYNEDIEDIESVVICSMPALLDMRENEDDSFILENIVSAYIYDMYGAVVVDYSAINSEFPQKQGYVYIIPRGFSVYSHEMISVSENEDGSFTVKTKVYIDAHDDEIKVSECTTLFVKNENSTFGFNIIRSDIKFDSLAI